MSLTMKQFATINGNESTLYGNLASLDSNRKCLLEDTGNLYVRSIYSLWCQLQIKTRVPLTVSILILSNSEWCFHSWLPNLLLTCLIRSAHTRSWRGQVCFFGHVWNSKYKLLLRHRISVLSKYKSQNGGSKLYIY